MVRRLIIATERFPIAGSFVIARGAKTEALVVTATIADSGVQGRGECVPYARYGETVDSVVATMEAARGGIEAGASRAELMAMMPAGAARNALDCALWDLEAKAAGRSAAALAGIAEPRPLVTAYTISLGEPDSMAAQARANAQRPLLKVKVGRPGDAHRIRAVTAAAPNSRIILDANEGWTGDQLDENLSVAAECGVLLVEQPLPAGDDARLAQIQRPVPVCADESVHGIEDLPALRARYDAVNIKLDKTGGLTAALAMSDAARRQGFGIMVGCMVGSSLAMAPALLVAQDADFVDLDGPLLLARDRQPGLTYRGSEVAPPPPELWG